MSWQIVRRLRQPLPPWSRIFDGLHLQENSSQADFFSRLALPDVSKVSWMGSRCHTFITEELGTVFLSLLLILKCPNSGKDLFQKWCNISPRSSPFSPFLRHFQHLCAKKVWKSGSNSRGEQSLRSINIFSVCIFSNLSSFEFSYPSTLHITPLTTGVWIWSQNGKSFWKIFAGCN